MEDLSEVKEILRKAPNSPGSLRLAGRYYLKAGEYKRAKDYFNQSIVIDPHLLPEVILDYEREITQNPANSGPRLSLAGFELFQGELDPCLLELEEALIVNPKDVEVYNTLGKIYAKLERVDDVIVLLERSVAEGIKDVSLTEILAGAYLEKGRINDAIKFYQELLNYRPNDKQTLRVLGELFVRVEDYNRAARCFQAMFSDDPEVSREVTQRLEGLLKVMEGNVLIREILADIYMRSLKPDLAVVKLLEMLRLEPAKLADVTAKLKGILKIYPDHPQASLALAETMAIKGNLSEAVEAYHDLVKNQPEHMNDAMEGYRKVLDLCPEQVLARNYLAETYLYKKMISEALGEFEEIVRIDPTAAEAVIAKCREIIKSYPQMLQARLVLGRAYLMKGELQRAAMEAEGVITIEKNFTAAYLLLGEVYFRLKLCRKAVGVLKTALSMEPYNLFVQEEFRKAKEKELDLEIETVKERVAEDQWKLSLHFDLAKLYLRKGLREDAIRELQTAVKDQVRSCHAYELLGRIYRQDGRFDLSAAQFNKARENVSPELIEFYQMVRINLGTTCEAQGNIQEALAIYEEALQENIDLEGLPKKIEQLRSTSLRSLRDKVLVAVIAKQNQPGVIAFWGREWKPSHNGRRDEVSVSFGQNYNTSGFEYYLKGMNKPAIEEFSLAVQLDSGFAAALNNLGVALIKEGRVAEARIRLEHAVHLDPNSAVLRNNYGLSCFLLGDVERARVELSSAAQLDPELPAVCVNLGDVLYFKKDVQRAIELYKKVGNYDILADIAEQRLLYKIP